MNRFVVLTWPFIIFAGLAGWSLFNCRTNKNSGAYLPPRTPLWVDRAGPSSSQERSGASGRSSSRASSLDQLVRDYPIEAWSRALARIPQDDVTWRSVLAQIARNDLGTACTWASQLAQQRPEIAQIAYATVLNSLAQAGDYVGACQAFEQVPNGEMKELLATNLVLQWGGDDPLAAAEWLIGLPEEIDCTDAFAHLGRVWAERRPLEAAEVLINLPVGEMRRLSLTEALNTWVEQDLASATAWIGKLPPEIDLDLVASKIARSPSLVQSRVDVALRWAESIVDGDQRTQALDSVLVRWANRDRSAALGYIQNSALLTPAQRVRLLEDVGINSLLL